MKYKIEYEDSERNKRSRYYNAKDPMTAEEMFKATVDHSFGDKDVTILGLYELSKRWAKKSMGATHEKE
ncbi:MAG: hypothetical protein CME70_18595 [Halobacteriovorax sp.]|nr:hypothetical protein [Halobacteriovorax sp.]|tara:strand:+ start:119 stop:325 length:207 start_codon:yes stop_codon:yes gene_type:complete